MNKKATLRLRTAYQAQKPYPDNDPRNVRYWRQLKRVYASLPRPDRHPDRLGAALVRAMKERYL